MDPVHTGPECMCDGHDFVNAGCAGFLLSGSQFIPALDEVLCVCMQNHYSIHVMDMIL